MKRLIALGLLIFCAVLLVTFPARVAYQWLAPAEVKLSGIDGSIWNGNATEGLAAGAYLRDLQWKIQPAALLKGQLAFRASADPGGGPMTSDVAVALNGTLSLSDLQGSVPLELVHPSFQNSGIRGALALQFSQLAIRDGMPVAADGSVTVSGLLAPALSSGEIGDFRADFQTLESGISGVVQDLRGVLDVDGTIELLPNRSYVFLGQVAATPDTPPSIINQLQYLGSPNENGKRAFRFEGQL